MTRETWQTAGELNCSPRHAAVSSCQSLRLGAKSSPEGLELRGPGGDPVGTEGPFHTAEVAATTPPRPRDPAAEAHKLTAAPSSLSC